MPSPAMTHGPLSIWGRLTTLLGVSIPLAGLVAAIIYFWGWGFHWTDLALFMGMYAASVVGVAVGFHRLFVHRSFETYRAIEFILVALGSTALQGKMIHWAGLHRYHHQHSDRPNDIHSPHHRGRGVLGFLRGFWHAHIGWAFHADPPDLDRYVPDLRKSRTLRIANELFPLWVFLGVAIPALLGGVITGSWYGALTGFLWGGLVRICVVHHLTWSINSVCHLWGSRPYACDDMSRDNVIFGIFAFGEGWHNTHHAFPTSARHGLRWWQLDISYGLIRSLELVGLAWNVKVPTMEARKRAARVGA